MRSPCDSVVCTPNLYFPLKTFTKLAAEMTPEQNEGLIRKALEEDGMALEDQEVFQNFTFADNSSILGVGEKG